jgi:hypothetical protein
LERAGAGGAGGMMAKDSPKPAGAKEEAAHDHAADIHYREYKILLQPERFHSREAFREFFKAVHHTAKRLEVRVEEAEHGFDSQIREVLFYDTAKFDLYNNSFILRKRTFYKEGWPERDHELTIKFRNPDLKTAASVDVRPTVGGEAKVKFKEELLPLKHELGGMRTLYSHGCELISPKVALDHALEDIASVFPALKRIDVHPRTRIELVNDVAVEEVQVNVGEIHFGHGYTGNLTIAIWRNRALEQPLSGEFAFQCKFENYRDLHKSSLELSEKFYKEVQTDARDWIKLGTTKTAMVYGLGNAPVHNHE